MREPFAARPRMGAWRRRFVRRVLLVAFVLQVPFGLLLGSLFDGAVGSRPWAALCALVSVGLVNVPLSRRLIRWWVDARTPRAYVWLVETPFFIHFVASLLFGPLSYLLLLAAGIARAAGWLRVLPSLAWLLGPLYAATGLLGAYATLVRRFWTVVRRIEVPITDLPAALEGYTLLQLSDIHCGPYFPRRWYRALARRATALCPDAIVVTGDLIANGTAYLSDVTEFFRGLRAREGVYGSMGNHDYYGIVEGVRGAVRAAGATVLLNQGTVLSPERDGGLYLAAIDDEWSHRDDLAAALADRPAGVPCVLLAHHPSAFPRIAARNDVDLVLSGHTHGGQFALPFAYKRWNLASLRERYSSGAYRIGRTMLYVHHGNGTSGPPARLGAAPEIAVFVLRRAVDATVTSSGPRDAGSSGRS